MAKRIPVLNNDSSDQTLMLEIQHRNTYAFEILYSKYRPAITGFALRMLQDPEKARDITQEVFFKLIQKRETYNPGKKFSSWLYRIAANLCIDEIRKRKFSAKPKEEAMAQIPGKTAEEPGALLEAKERDNAVKKAVNDLPPDHKALIILHQYQDFTYDEIAEALNKQPNWVKWHLKITYDELAKSLKYYSSNTCHEERK